MTFTNDTPYKCRNYDLRIVLALAACYLHPINFIIAVLMLLLLSYELDYMSLASSDVSTQLHITFFLSNVSDISCISIDDAVPEGANQVIAAPVLNCPHCAFTLVHPFSLQRHIRVIMFVTYVETDK